MKNFYMYLIGLGVFAVFLVFIIVCINAQNDSLQQSVVEKDENISVLSNNVNDLNKMFNLAMNDKNRQVTQLQNNLIAITADRDTWRSQTNTVTTAIHGLIDDINSLRQDFNVLQLDYNILLLRKNDINSHAIDMYDNLKLCYFAMKCLSDEKTCMPINQIQDENILYTIYRDACISISDEDINVYDTYFG